MSVARRIHELSSSARAPELAALVGVLLSLPTLIQGKFLDDHLRHAAALRGVAPWRFTILDDAPIAALRERGVLGWWASDELHVEFMRPLSALSHALDFALWPNAIWLMHLENVLLYALLIVAVGRVLQRMLGPGPVAGLACLVFAIDETHATTVMWISGRNTILAALFGVLALWAHLRWRDDHPEARRWPFALAGPLCFMLALLSAEAGVAALGYLLAWSLTRDGDSWVGRLAPLLPYLLILALWRVAYTQLDFGVRDSGLYTDPGDAPLAFAGVALLHAPALGFIALSLPVAELLTAAPERTFIPALGFLALAWALAPLWSNPEARALLLGMLAAAVPFASTAASSRTMLLLGLGSAGLFAMAWERRREPAFSGRLRRALLWFMAACQLVLAPLAFVPSAFALRLVEPPHRQLAAQMPAEAELVVLVNAPFEITGLYPPAIRELEGGGWPEHVYLLFAGHELVEVTRVDARTLELRSEAGWAKSRLDRLTRDWASSGLAVGEVVELERAAVEVVELGAEGRPARVRVRFDEPLDEALILGFEGPELVRWQPELGEARAFRADVTKP